MFYKIIYDKLIIDVLNNPRWVLWLKRTCRFLASEITTANGVMSSNGLEVYAIDYKGGFENHPEPYKTVKVVEITEAEYNHIRAQISDKVLDGNGNEITVQAARAEKIAEMKAACDMAIVSGFDIELSDGLIHHFSLQVVDQLKIAKLNERALNGVEELPYHADGEVCKYFPKEDIMAINANMEYMVEYHTTYFNSLKFYLNNIFNAGRILEIKYGDPIPEEYRSDVLKVMLGEE